MKLVTIRNGLEAAVCESGDVGWDYRYYQTHMTGTESAAKSAYDFIREPEVVAARGSYRDFIRS